MNWAFRKKLFYGSIFILIVLGVLFLFLYPIINREPTCFDGRQNGDEVGVDCGGSCALYCTDQITNPVVVWSRSFEAAPGVYNAVAYVENRNNNASISSVSYRFRLYDESGVLVGERAGSTFVGLKGRALVFESAIPVGTYEPTRTVFEFTTPFDWADVSDQFASVSILSGNTQFTRATGNPRVTADIRNASLFVIKDVQVSVLLYGADNNVFAVSKTVVDSIGPSEQRSVYFSWPQGFDQDPTRIEILPTFDPTNIRRK